MSECVFATITLDERGGGVATASRLMWDVIRDRWNDRAELVTLVAGRRGDLPAPGVASRLAFGARMLAAQGMGRARWIFFSHLSLAKAQAYVPRAYRRPHAIFLHGIEAWRPLTAAQRTALTDARVLIANSSYTARRVREAHPWVKPIAVCPLALPRDVTHRSHDIASDRPVALIVARMAADERYKGHDQLLESWPEVLRRVPSAELVVVGGGDDRRRLEVRARELALGDHVRFTGFVSNSELALLYERAAVFVMPSRNEGFGLVYLEAMAHGLPCVGSLHDAAKDVIVDGVTGFLVDQAQPQRIAQRIVQLMTDGTLRRRMGIAGQRRVSETFTREHFRDAMIPVLERELASGSEKTIPAAAEPYDI